MDTKKQRISQQRTVMTTLERMIAFEAEDERRVGEPPAHALDGAVDGYVCRGLMRDLNYREWPDDALRELVRLLVTHCSDEELASMVTKARSQAKWVREYTRECEEPGGEWFEADRKRAAERRRKVA
ncbi:MAG: hypothetical protein AB7O24_26135 [Kofleriaceae bacterium]